MSTAMRDGRRFRGGAQVSCLLALLAAVPLPVRAQSVGSVPAATVDDPKVKQLFDLLQDPGVRHYLEGARSSAAPAAPAPTKMMTVSLAAQLDGLRRHIGDLLHSTRALPSQAQAAHGMALAAVAEWGAAATLLALGAFVLMGFAAQGAFHLAARPARRWLMALPLETVDERVRAVFARSGYGLAIVASFALGSIGAFLLFDWPVLIKQLLLGYLLAFLLVRLAAVAGRFLLAPGAERFRVVPISTETAWFIYVRLIAFTVILAFGGVTIGELSYFGLSDLAAEFCRDALGLVLAGLAIETVWRLPLLATGALERAEARHRRRTRALVLSVAVAAMWLCWVLQATTLFWLFAFATALPIAIRVGRASVLHILRPTGRDEGDRSLQAILFEHGVRSFMLIAAALVLAWIFGVDLASLTMEDTLTTRLVRAVVSVAVIGLAAQFLWTAIRATLNRRMQAPLPQGSAGADVGHTARMQTLLPIVSNILLAALVLVAAMMMLAAIGVQIGPLIASAGVVGVAIGFGAQTLVKDVISGIFYLVDDAFRIGEYIQSGSYKGTVESFSLRSVKLRHQRGALYTIPFGSLGAVQNQSRDWVVDKIVLNVPYGTDLEKVRKLIKKIGAELTEDEEFGPDILSPLKMQGVAQFGDYAIQIQTKMMTRPGDAQFAARRRALLLIKHAFEANDIGFAVPTVQVAGDATGAVPAAMILSSRAAAGDSSRAVG